MDADENLSPRAATARNAAASEQPAAGAALQVVKLGRREFAKLTGMAGAGLVLGLRWQDATAQGTVAPRAAAPTTARLGGLVVISPDDWVTVLVGQSEMGQGVSTTIPMVVAEELGADWARVRWEQGANDAKNFGRPGNGPQITGGSSSKRILMPALQKSGAAAREMLIAAAAKQWQVDKSSLRAEQGFIVAADGRRASFGSLAEAAGREPVPADPVLKQRKDWKLIGTSPPRLDIPAKTNGSAVFGLDVRLPGMLTAVVARPPVFGSSVESFDKSAAMQVKGVRGVEEIGTGVAVLADNFWSAKKGRDALRVTWRKTAADAINTDALRARMEQAASQPGLMAEQRGQFADAFARAATKVEASYATPYLAHQCMEPINQTAWIHDGMVEVWGGVQSQTIAQNAAAAAARADESQVRIHTTLLGGGFGRRSETNDTAEAVELAAITGKPVKVVWTREDDMRHDYYRPMTVNKLRAGLDAQGKLVAWNARLAGQSIFARRAPQNMAARGGIDSQSVECAVNMPYDRIAHLLVEQCTVQGHVPVGFWRSVGASQNLFVVESFVDELAHAARQDPLAFRLSLITPGGKHERHKRVLELAAQKAGWGTPLPPGRARGIAVGEAFEGFVAQVVEASVAKDGTIKVERVVAACDFGTIVHPEIVRSQVVSSVVTGIDNALFNDIRIENGAVANSNFHDNPLPRMTDVPVSIEVHIVESTAKPGGVGEPAVPPVAPALANAVFALTGQRLRSLPLRAKPWA